jgi:hypothetical protein
MEKMLQHANFGSATIFAIFLLLVVDFRIEHEMRILIEFQSWQNITSMRF